MKHLLSLLTICLFMSSTMMAQKADRSKGDRIKSLRIAFITERLNLTPQESEKFWPIYNEFHQKRRELQDSFKKERGNKKIDTDAQAAQRVEDSLDYQEEEIKLKRVYYEKLKKAIPVKKVAMLEKAERDFRAQVVKEVRKRRGKNRGNNKK